jgi:hypothetical protein
MEEAGDETRSQIQNLKKEVKRLKNKSKRLKRKLREERYQNRYLLDRLDTLKRRNFVLARRLRIASQEINNREFHFDEE